MTFQIKRGDQLPAFAVRLRNGDGSVPDLTGAVVVLNMRNARSKAPIIARAAVSVSDLADALVRYDWTAPDTATSGSFEAEFEVVFADGRPGSYPNKGFIPVAINEDGG